MPSYKGPCSFSLLKTKLISFEKPHMSASPNYNHRSLHKKGSTSHSTGNLIKSKVHSPSPLKKSGLHIALQEDYSPRGLSNSAVLSGAIAHRFNQAERFPPIKDSVSPKYYGSPSSFATNKGPSMGFGDRSDITKLKNKDSTDHPSPLAYRIKSEFDHTKKGRTFGLPHSVYEKVYVEGSKDSPLAFKKDLPGPGSYDITKDIIAGKGKMSFQARGKMFNEGLGLGSPKCNQYSPKTELVTPAKYKNVSLGIGKKYDFTKKKDNFPGPSDYSPNFFKNNLPRKYVSPKVGHDCF